MFVKARPKLGAVALNTSFELINFDSKIMLQLRAQA